jgi:hypothetical protein
LQHAAQSLQGEHTLVRFLGEQIHKPAHSADAQKMRLETDAQCVQVITYHKSKGLQYPLVFVPFMGSFRTEKSSKTSFVEDEEANDESLYQKQTILLGIERGQRSKTECSKVTNMEEWHQVSERSTRGMMSMTILTTLALGLSNLKKPSIEEMIESEMRSLTLSGCPSDTDSLVKI